jgi:hypothetical protein
MKYINRTYIHIFTHLGPEQDDSVEERKNFGEGLFVTFGSVFSIVQIRHRDPVGTPPTPKDSRRASQHS